MTPAQTKLYWREWAAVRAANPNADRHELHARALGEHKSSKDFTNQDLDRVLGVFRAVSDPANLNSQLRQLSQPVRRLIWRIKKMAPEAYWRAVARDRFGSELLGDLSETQLTQLRNTLAARMHAQRRRQLDGRAAANAEATATSRKPTQRELAKAAGIECPF